MSERPKMRRTIHTACFILILGISSPAQAQLRSAIASEQSAVQVYDYGTPGFSLNKFFSPAHFRMGHSFEFSSGSYGGNTSSVGMYTNSLMWQFSSKLAARADISYAYSPDGNSNLDRVMGGNNGRLFVQNAEIAYRPAKNMEIHFSYRQSPYGGYYSPYGYNGYRNGGMFESSYGSRNLFWNEGMN